MHQSKVRKVCIISAILFFTGLTLFVSAESETMGNLPYSDEKTISILIEIVSQNIHVLKNVSDASLETYLFFYWIIGTILRYALAVIGIVLLTCLFITRKFISLFHMT